MIKKLPKSLNLKFMGFNIKVDLLQKLNDLSEKQKCSRSFLINNIIEVYFELLNEVSDYEN